MMFRRNPLQPKRMNQMTNGGPAVGKEAENKPLTNAANSRQIVIAYRKILRIWSAVNQVARSVCGHARPALGAKMTADVTRLFFVGDVMLGRGVDQILEHKNDPVLYEDYVKDATEYVELAVRVNGPLPTAREPDYVWGDAIDILDEFKPALRIINLETAVTTHGQPAPRKGIHYRMHPGNINVLQSAKVDCVVLSNNHVLDWSQPGLLETLRTIETAGIKYAGAGSDLDEAQSPAVFDVGDHRVLVFAVGHGSSGVVGSWSASKNKPGVHVIDTNTKSVKSLSSLISRHKKDGDVIVLSIHWGSNWSWDVESDHVDFAHRLIDEAGVDLVHGHSSHHVKGVEIYKGKLIMYGCGDFLSDYEGIASASLISDRQFRDDVSLMYFPSLDSQSGRLTELLMIPMRLKKLQVVKATGKDRQWLWENMSRESAKWGVDLEDRGDCFAVVL